MHGDGGGPQTVVDQAFVRTPNFSPHGRDPPDAVWVGPRSPGQPDSLGFGFDELGEGGLMRSYVGMDVDRQCSQIAIVDAAGASSATATWP
jgi:hypothetical protein